MQRSSIKKSSTFKIQAQKNVFKGYLENIAESQTARSYPHLLNTITKTSEVVYDFCYSYCEDSPFIRGLNYNSRNFGFSEFQNILTYREWIPNAKEVYLFGQFNQFNKSSHQLEPIPDDPGMFMLEIDTNIDHIVEESKLMLRVIDEKGKEHFMSPPSCYAFCEEFGIFTMNNKVPVNGPSKKITTIQAYTLDFGVLPLKEAEIFVEENRGVLEKFNVIILRQVFDCEVSLLDRCRLEKSKMQTFRDLVNKLKNELGVKVILEWSLKGGRTKYPGDNPLESEIIKQTESNTYQYDLSKDNVMAMYMASLSYYKGYYAIDGFHFKHIDEFKEQNGQILIKCINILNQRLSDNGLTLASSKKEVPGLNQPILEGGLGFTFTYNYDTNLLLSHTHQELKEKFEKIFTSSNCISINFDNLDQEHFLNLTFAFFVSQKGVFCKGDFHKIDDQLKKLLFVRKKSDLFDDRAKIISISDEQMTIQRGPACIMFNFSENEIQKKIESDMELMYYSSEEDLHEKNLQITMVGKSCCIYEHI